MHRSVSLSRKWLLAVLVGPVVIVTLASCSGGDVVGRTGESNLTSTDVKDIVAQLPEATRAAVMADKAALERVVRAELVRRNLVAQAKAAKVDSDPAVAMQLDRARDDALVRAWVARQARVADDYPTDQDLRLAYQSNLAALSSPAKYRVAQIFIAAPNGVSPAELAQAMRKAAEVGAKIPDGDFAALAREYSEHADSAARGGDVGSLPANQMLPEIVAAVRDLPVGGTTGPVKTSQGLHYVKLLDRETQAPPGFEEVRDQLRAAMRARRAQELEQAYLTELNARLDVAVDQIALAQLKSDPKASDRK